MGLHNISLLNNNTERDSNEGLAVLLTICLLPSIPSSRPLLLSHSYLFQHFLLKVSFPLSALTRSVILLLSIQYFTLFKEGMTDSISPICSCTGINNKHVRTLQSKLYCKCSYGAENCNRFLILVLTLPIKIFIISFPHEILLV